MTRIIHIDDKDSHISTDRAYFPKKKDISNCIRGIVSTGKNFILDQLQLEKLAAEWQSISRNKYGDASSCFFRKSEKKIILNFTLMEHQLPAMTKVFCLYIKKNGKRNCL